MKNCEKYKTGEDRYKAFCKFCDGKACDTCVIGRNRYESVVLCTLKWLDLEVEEEKPMPCPFCGANTEIEIDEAGCYSISCIHCEYGSPEYNKEEYAIAAHNRICRAVAAHKESEVK